MNIAITYPPLENPKGIPLLGQNRQFQWFNNPTYIYPMVPAYAATLLKDAGFDVVWNDAIAEGWSYKDYLDYYKSSDFDLVMIESKTPVIKMHWKIIDELKEIKPDTLIVLVGDHVTAFPEESMNNCSVDYVLTGGNYDFLLKDLCLNIRDNDRKVDVQKLDKGIYYRDAERVCNTGQFILDQNLDELPMIDRELTKWELYSEKNGNYSKLPGTYTMAARDCWHHKCTFCSWTTLYPKYFVRSPESLLDEVGMLIDNYGVKEIMDDSGAFPTGEWLRAFCKGMIERGYNKRVIMDCNMRLCALSFDDYKLMKEAGFRFILFGMESANQDTLDRIVKAEKIEDMIESLKMAKKAGLSPHITLMFGYPWESEEQIKNTVKLGQTILKKNWAHTLQATVLIPYPGTPLYDECKKKDWFLTTDYEDFDQRMPVMKTPVGSEKIKEAVQKVYKIAFHPEFVFHRLAEIRSLEDVKFIFRAVNKVFGHLLDFGKQSPVHNIKEKIAIAAWFILRGDKRYRFNYELNEDSLVFDLGGYLGEFTQCIVDKYNCKVMVFEPVPDFADHIKERFKENNKVTVFQYGLEDDDSKERIFLHEDSSSVYAHEDKNSILIEYKSVVSFFKEHDIVNVDLMKINIEGGEYQLLDKIIKTGLIERIDNLQIQFHKINSIESSNKMKMIWSNLEKTHYSTWKFRPYVWENWKKKDSL